MDEFCLREYFLKLFLFYSREQNCVKFMAMAPLGKILLVWWSGVGGGANNGEGLSRVRVEVWAAFLRWFQDKRGLDPSGLLTPKLATGVALSLCPILLSHIRWLCSSKMTQSKQSSNPLLPFLPLQIQHWTKTQVEPTYTYISRSSSSGHRILTDHQLSRKHILGPWV